MFSTKQELQGFSMASSFFPLFFLAQLDRREQQAEGRGKGAHAPAGALARTLWAHCEWHPVSMHIHAMTRPPVVTLAACCPKDVGVACSFDAEMHMVHSTLPRRDCESRRLRAVQLRSRQAQQAARWCTYVPRVMHLFMDLNLISNTAVHWIVAFLHLHGNGR